MKSRFLGNYFNRYGYGLAIVEDFDVVIANLGPKFLRNAEEEAIAFFAEYAPGFDIVRGLVHSDSTFSSDRWCLPTSYIAWIFAMEIVAPELRERCDQNSLRLQDAKPRLSYGCGHRAHVVGRCGGRLDDWCTEIVEFAEDDSASWDPDSLEATEYFGSHRLKAMVSAILFRQIGIEEAMERFFPESGVLGKRILKTGVTYTKSVFDGER